MPEQITKAQWQQLCFHRALDEAREADFTSDLILADRVIKPLLRQESQQIMLWRFHRRAADDAAGHQFSFFYYSDHETASRLYASAQTHAEVAMLSRRGKLLKLSTSCRSTEHPEQLAALSDTNWDQAIQTSWPYFIMGVSAAWLQLIEELSLANETGHEDLYQHYAQVEQQLIALWQEQGQHAYLHHLNAIFGYEPLFINNWMRF